MTNSIIQNTAIDIYEYPAVNATDAKQLTIGDLHGNSMFLMHFLVSNAVVKITPDNYLKLAELYQKGQSTLSKEEIQKFKSIIDNLEIDPKSLLRFIGDEICDRGQNDYFVFKIIDKLKKSNQPVEILLSNHGLEFLFPYEKEEELYAPNIGSFGQSRSMDNMRALLEKNIITEEELDSLVKDSYLPNLKLISYSLDDNSITLFSHAGIDLETIRALANKFAEQGVVYKEDTAEDLAQTIEAINLVFAQHVAAGTVHTLVNDITWSPANT